MQPPPAQNCPARTHVTHTHTHLQAGDDLAVCAIALCQLNPLYLLRTQLLNVLLTVLPAVDWKARGLAGSLGRRDHTQDPSMSFSQYFLQ